MNEQIHNSKGTPLFNPWMPEFIADPYPFYHRLRATDPMHLTPLGFYIASTKLGRRVDRSPPRCWRLARGIQRRRNVWRSVGVEAIIPVNRDSGTGIGVLAQLHLYLDDIFPRSYGRPPVRRERKTRWGTSRHIFGMRGTGIPTDELKGTPCPGPTSTSAQRCPSSRGRGRYRRSPAPSRPS
jgi:hypothetical protein